MKTKNMIVTAVSFVAPYSVGSHFTAGWRYYSKGYVAQDNGRPIGANFPCNFEVEAHVYFDTSSHFNGEAVVYRIEHQYDADAVERKKKRYRHMTIRAFAKIAKRWCGMSDKQAKAWGRIQSEPYFYDDGSLVKDTVVHDFAELLNKPWEVDQATFDYAVEEELSCW